MIAVLSFLALLTSAITAFVGVGGGMLMMAMLPLFLPIAAVVPVHAVVQLSSNISRAGFAWRDVQYRYLLPFFCGGVLGALSFSVLLHYLSFDYLPLFIGSYILLSQWSSWFNRAVARFESFFILGFIHVGAGTLVGTVGPIQMTLVMKHTKNHHQVVTTVAAMATISHILKITAFMMIGVKVWAYWDVMLLMVLGAIAGSYLGTKLRRKADTSRFKLAMKILLSVLAVQMLVRFLYSA